MTLSPRNEEPTTKDNGWHTSLSTAALQQRSHHNYLLQENISASRIPHFPKIGLAAAHIIPETPVRVACVVPKV